MRTNLHTWVGEISLDHVQELPTTIRDEGTGETSFMSQMEFGKYKKLVFAFL